MKVGRQAAQDIEKQIDMKIKSKFINLDQNRDIVVEMCANGK